MHCPSCKLIIERKLIQLPGITSVRASVAEKNVTIGYEGSKPSTDQLNDVLQGNGYVFSEPEHAGKSTFFRKYWKPSAIIITLAAGLYLLFASGISSMIMVSESSSY
ncbi:MAG: heavy-metal-associated domain-containing protein, partial [Chlorobiaceae bacterium]|nr:heavy-metal-associated domain-containing protein [Chlorobiaceae bacterium]